MIVEKTSNVVINYLDYCYQPGLMEPFYESAAFDEGVKFIRGGGKLLCLTGLWGSGKTATAKQIYKSVTHKHPIIMQIPLKFDVGNEPIIFDGAILKEITNGEKGSVKGKYKDFF